MRSARFLRVAVLLLGCSVVFPPSDYPERLAQPPQSTPTNPLPGTVVYVSDFELDIYHSRFILRPTPQPSAGASASAGAAKTAGGPAGQSSSASSSNGPNPAPNNSSAGPAQNPVSSASGQTQSSSSRLDPDENVRSRANELINVTAENVVSALQSKGYEARRLRRDQPRPEKGLLIRGVFAESDDQNRARRLLFGGPSTSSKMILYVGVNNLKNPEQPLYELANPPAPDSRYGPVITVTSYSPAVRFELAKKPSDDEIKEIAKQIAADLSGLLSANPMMSAE